MAPATKYDVTSLEGKKTVEQIAAVCHEANRAYAFAIGEKPDTIQPHWDAASDEIRESSRVGVRKALEGATPEQLHVSWCETKRKAGWQYGPVRDNAKKIHPCLVGYAELPAAQRLKDTLFHAIVAVLRPAASLT